MRPRFGPAIARPRYAIDGRAKPLDASGGGVQRRARQRHPHQERHRT